MRVLVTGGAGFIGSHIVDRLIAEGDNVLVVDNLSTGKKTNVHHRAELVEMDVGDPALKNVTARFGPDLVTHCAAQPSVPASTADPVLDAGTNIMGGINVYMAAAGAGCAQFIYVTTGGAMYGMPEYVPCDEDHPVRPISPYGLSKWTFERYLRVLARDTMQVKVLRLANVYGPRQVPYGEAGVVAIFTLEMLRNGDVVIDGDGEQTKDYVYVGDVVEAHELARKAAGSIAVNVGTGVGVSVNELFVLISAETGYTKTPVHGPERPGDVRSIVLANEKAGRLLGWRPGTPLRDALRETLAWMKGQA